MRHCSRTTYTIARRPKLAAAALTTMEYCSVCGSESDTMHVCSACWGHVCDSCAPQADDFPCDGLFDEGVVCANCHGPDYEI